MKMKMGTFSRCFSNWNMNVKQIKRERNLVLKFSMRMRNKTLYATFDGLAKNASHQRSLKITCFKAMCRIANSQLSVGFINWAAFVRGER